ncbi:MAG: T9SS type A sorting domain-containing protein [Saprospiraceae bacterium]|nr:T9SS type A sorting domain-containing protein [Saprospiraceae bacterium]
MKRALLMTFTLSIAFVAFGQYRGLPVRTIGNTKVKAITNVDPGVGIVTEQPAIPLATGFRSTEEEIGTTNFDIQTTASLGRRIGEPGNGHIGAAWQMAFQQPNWPDRGTGYNHFDGNDWGPNPTDQIEPSRSGYPSFTVTGNGTEVVISHKSVGTIWQLVAYTKGVGETTWTEHILPTNVPAGNVWAKIAAGGPDGNSLHVVAMTFGSGFDGGAIYNGMDNHPLYWRSNDSGQTWDKQDIVLPGADSSQYLSINSESYTIEARGETVAIAITPYFGEMLLFKSENNGDSWTKQVIYDFPLDKWNGEVYYNDNLPTDPNAPDSLFIFSTDGSNSIVIDENSNAHVFFNHMYWRGNPADTSYTLDLGTNGIAYWNEQSQTISIIAGGEDWDGDSEITLGGNPDNYRYGNSGVTAFPNATIDEEGNLYLVFMAFHELFTDADGLTYRHIFITKSVDGGETWSAPFDLINEDITDEPGFIEAAYPAIPAHTGDAIQLIYQQDYIPGLTAANVTVPDQFIMHFSLDKETFGPISSAREQTQPAQRLTLTPNPAHGQVQVGFELAAIADVEIGVFDLFGKRLSYKQLGKLSAGEHRTVLGLRDLPKGIYAVKLVADGLGSVQKLVVD